MISAVLYASSTGSCRRYAQTLAATLRCPAYEAKKCPALDGREVIYIGWLMAGRVSGLAAVQRRARVRALVQVGMAPTAQNSEETCRAKNGGLEGVPVFTLQGAYRSKSLPLPLRAVMKVVCRDIAARLVEKAKTAPLDAQEQACLRMALNGEGEPASWDGLQPVIDWARQDAQ